MRRNVHVKDFIIDDNEDRQRVEQRWFVEDLIEPLSDAVKDIRPDHGALDVDVTGGDID